MHDVRSGVAAVIPHFTYQDICGRCEEGVCLGMTSSFHLGPYAHFILACIFLKSVGYLFQLHYLGL